MPYVIVVTKHNADGTVPGLPTLRTQAAWADHAEACSALGRHLEGIASTGLLHGTIRGPHLELLMRISGTAHVTGAAAIGDVTFGVLDLADALNVPIEQPNGTRAERLDLFDPNGDLVNQSALAPFTVREEPTSR